MCKQKGIPLLITILQRVREMAYGFPKVKEE